MRFGLNVVILHKIYVIILKDVVCISINYYVLPLQSVQKSKRQNMLKAEQI